MSGERTKIDMPALTFEARVTGGRVKRVPSGVLLESETSQLVRVGPNKPTDETSSLIPIFTEVVEAAAALLGWTPPPKCKMVTGEQIAAEARLGIIGNEPRLLLDEGVAEEVVAEVFGGPIIDHDPGDEDDEIRLLAAALPPRFRFLLEPLDLSGIDWGSPRMQKALAAAREFERCALERLSAKTDPVNEEPG